MALFPPIRLSRRHSESPPSEHHTPWPLLALALVSIWTAVGLLFASAGGGVAQTLMNWYLWGLLAWFIVFIDRRLPVPPERLSVRLLWHLPLSVLFSTLHMCLALIASSAMLGTLPRAAGWAKVVEGIASGGVQWNMLNYWLILGTYLAFNYHREVEERRRRAAHLESLLAEARLTALRAQLHPHFLFNALNTVSAYVETDPKLARDMLEHLGDLLRFSLNSEDQHEVSLAQEIEALEHYLAIQSARFAGKLRTSLDIPPELRHARVPALLLQPLVENAIVHGLSPLPSPGELRVAARSDRTHLTLTVSDNGAGLAPHWSLDRDAGIGLSNTRGRLAEMYGPDHSFAISSAPFGGVVAEIRIPCAFAAPRDNGGRRAKSASPDRGR